MMAVLGQPRKPFDVEKPFVSQSSPSTPPLLQPHPLPAPTHGWGRGGGYRGCRNALRATVEKSSAAPRDPASSSGPHAGGYPTV